MSSNESIKGRGAQMNVANRFFELSHEIRDEFLEYCQKEGEHPESNKTNYLKIYPKTIVNKVESPDVRMMYSMNPYQGCEHGCIYCYARNTHEYWGYGPGLDFERTILIKENAPALLEDFLKRPKWVGDTIVLSGNTDCYQPAERKFEITRKCLEIFLKYKHPVGIITKNTLFLRDLDIIKELGEQKLIGLNISLTSLNEKTRQILEPRTASVYKRLKAIETLSKLNIPVNVMMAPIIPSINSHEILPLAKKVSEAGAISIAHTVVRLNGAIGIIFEDWIRKTFPERADKVLNQIRECHAGNLNDSRFGERIRGTGKIAEQIQQLMALAKLKYFKGNSFPVLSPDSYLELKNPQMRLF
ncbi:PA0069 family radical SAM protein [Aegicerativicinus sediminis]|uniref:PA0069 family radical SAM protein n=1 Tax=Aegicerativicinus sediminis TaxID=2893202 RepID=UPI001E558E4A|nr:PA0069 family radical SAM protein [Aegicerativicinus sediminis]